MDPWKASGPDVFPPGFYLSQWDIVKYDLVKVIQNFFRSGFIYKRVNQTRLMIVPKVKIHSSPTDYLPIDLCNTSYKLISKLMARRMKVVLTKVISPLQSTYVSGRLITDNISLAHEIIHTLKRKKKGENYIALKLDMSKAFDKLECPFKPTWGILQGDHISPYLFIISMEALSREMVAVEFSKSISGIQIDRRAPPISHLLFADDCLIFVKANLDNINNLQDILNSFSSSSGQVLNYQKSSICFSNNISTEAATTITRILNVKKMEPEEKYLGILLFLNKKKRVSFNNLVVNMERRLSKWRGTTHSQAGRGVMVRNVLSTIPLHQMSSFELPEETIKKMDSVHLRFWWNKADKKVLCLTSFSSLCKTIDDGGLNFVVLIMHSWKKQHGEFVQQMTHFWYIL
ncbi:uncharacterized protein LOC113304923 [Papaver somniferum]|uniref:uncharacterized protein LOC113304923 n=1 Tax=Papaver somniferum TaxID=3469 RepID=UPI000E701C1F|nr:uncharacterized protein LOC113304923 [Papaver somniferum]